MHQRYRPFEVVAPGFVADTADTAESGLRTSACSLPAPFAAVELRISQAAGGGGTVCAGLATETGDHLLGCFDPGRRQLSLRLRWRGRVHRIRRRTVDVPDTFRLAFVLCENQVTLLVHDAGGWRPVLTERERVSSRLDLRDPDTLARFRYAWGRLPGADTGPAAQRAPRVTDVRAGLFGMTGLRDPHLVQYADGTPYLRDGKAYLTATCAGLGFFPQAHWGVFRFDLADPVPLEQVGQLYFHRDGLLLGDHAGQVVRDGERWIVATSSWGDFDGGGVHVRHTTTTQDVLHGVHVLRTKRTALPTRLSTWDPALTRIDDVWHVAFVESPSQKPFEFRPALAVAPAGAEWDAGLRLVGAATDLRRCEGPVIAKVEGRWWVLASDGEGRSYPVFTTDLHRVGRLDAPYPTNIPHPQLVPHPEGGFLMVTFDGTQYGEKVMGYGGHGDVIVMRSG